MSWFPANYERRRVTVDCVDESLTSQEFKDACDINKIIKKLVKTGIAPVQTKEPIYGDYSEAPTYQEACNVVLISEEQFNGLNAETRERFMHDPAKFLEFCNNPENLEEMQKMGLAKAPIPEPGPLEVTVIPSENTEEVVTEEVVSDT